MSTEGRVVTAAGVLAGARKAIERLGLAKHEFQDAQGRVCLIGAMRLAAWGDALAAGPEWSRAARAFAGADLETYKEAREYVIEMVGTSVPAHWSDRPETTVQDVLDMLAAAEVLALARQSEAGVS
jgi:hypothetical protein